MTRRTEILPRRVLCLGHVPVQHRAKQDSRHRRTPLLYGRNAESLNKKRSSIPEKPIFCAMMPRLS